MKKINWSDHLINFFAVILGVSLAFFANDSASRSNEEKEYKYLIQAIYDELSDDIETYKDYQIPNNQETIRYLSRLVETLSTKEQSDSLEYFLSSAFEINSYSPQNIAFNSMVSSGKLDLIKSFELRRMLLEYDLYSKEAEAQGQAQYDYLMNQFVRWVLDNPSYSQSVDINNDNAGFILLTSIYLGLIQGKTIKYENLEMEADSIKKFMETEFKFLEEHSESSFAEELE